MKSKLNQVKPKSPSIVFTHATLLDGEQLLEDAGIIIDNGKILSVGPTNDILKQNQNSYDVVDASGFVITPGLVNSHSHSCLTYVKNLCHDAPDVIRSVFFKTEKNLTAELVEGLSLPYILAGLRSGVTTFADHFYYIQGTARALEQFGARGVLFECINDRSGPLKDKIKWEDARMMIESWPFSSRILPGVGPHATDTTTPAMLKQMAQYAKSMNLPLHFHLGQTDIEMQFTKKEFKKTPVQIASEAGALGENTLAVHLIATDGNNDLNILKDSGATIGFCPGSQIVYERLADIKSFYDAGLPIALGTDCSLHDTGDLGKDVRLTALISRDRGIRFNSVNDQFNWIFPQVTTNGAKALGLSKIGRLKKGFVADLVFIRPELQNMPINNLRAEYLYGFDSQNIEHVMIEGRWALWNKKAQAVSESDISEQFETALSEIRRLIS